MEKKSFLSRFSTCIPALLIGLGIVALGMFIKGGLVRFADRDRVVTVRGLCEKDVKADRVTWPIVSKEVGNDLTAIYDNVQRTNNAIVEFLKTNGIEDSEIQVNAPQVVDMQADNYSGQASLYRYNVTTVVVVTSNKVDKVKKLITRQAELLQKGIAIVAGDYNYQTRYDYTGLNDIKPSMIAEATKNARKSAQKFADDSQSSLGKIRSASQGQISIEDRDQYTPDIKRVRVVSTVEFYLKD